jgi:leucyl/phenylalanyl-tRNA---protein transferase
VIRACSAAPRAGQAGTWIVPDMIAAYVALHAAGHAHSVETWVDGELTGGLYCVAIGQAVFGESMFARRPDASKIALAALVGFCRRHALPMIDCQQNTAHLTSLGASEMRRADFVAHVARARAQPAPDWDFAPVYWNELLSARPTQPT